MIFGDENIFAIDAELTQIGKNACINYCFVSKSKIIGDKNITSLLTVELEFIKNILNLRGKRQNNNLLEKSLSTKQMTDTLINYIYGDDSLDTHKMNYDLNPNSNLSESFTRFDLFLIEYDGYELLLSKDEWKQIYTNIKIPSCVFYACFEKLMKWINQSTALALISNIN